MTDTGKYSVLVVDDDVFYLTALVHTLQPDYAIYVAKDGENAIRIANEKKPDVVILDLLIRGMDGYDVINELKKSERTRDIPIIIITGLDKHEAEEKVLALGATDVMTKPLHFSVVKLKIQSLMNLVGRDRHKAFTANPVPS